VKLNRNPTKKKRRLLRDFLPSDLVNGQPQHDTAPKVGIAMNAAVERYGRELRKESFPLKSTFIVLRPCYHACRELSSQLLVFPSTVVTVALNDLFAVMTGAVAGISRLSIVHSNTNRL
jgi:hypothetical protein